MFVIHFASFFDFANYYKRVKLIFGIASLLPHNQITTIVAYQLEHKYISHYLPRRGLI